MNNFISCESFLKNIWMQFDAVEVIEKINKFYVKSKAVLTSIFVCSFSSWLSKLLPKLYATSCSFGSSNSITQFKLPSNAQWSTTKKEAKTSDDIH